MALGLWELALVVAALVKVSRRRQLRRHYRTPTEVAAVMDETIVRVVDLTTEGAGLLSPRPMTEGSVVELVAELPMSDGRLRATRLQLTVTACRPEGDATQPWRIGGTVTARHDPDRDALVEYCHVVATRTRLYRSGRLLAGADGPRDRRKAPGASELLEALTANG